MKRLILWVVIAAVALFVVVSVLPLNRTNPPVTREVNWDSPQTRALAQRACFDCHSNETVWPTYAYIAPSNLLLWRHVTEGRGGLNFSEWNRGQPPLEQIQEQVQRGSMPPWDYLLMHAPAKLTDAEKQQLLTGLQATYAKDPPQILRHREEG
jgi:cytochrome c551/c552